MFDLFRSRDKAVRYLLGALLGLVALSLVITLIPGYGASSAPREQLVAEIGGEPLTVREVQTTLQSALRNRQMPPEMMSFYVPQVIDQMIAERAVAYQAERMGFKITDEELANAIRSMIQQAFPNGEFNRAAYGSFLAQQGLTIPEFERNVKANLLLLRLQNIALEGSIVTPAEVEQEFRRKNDKIKVQYVKFSPPQNAGSPVTITPEEIRNFYTQQKNQFNTPEKRSFSLLIADEAKVGASLQIPEPELRAAYNSSLDKYRTPDRVHVRHILVKTTDKPKEEVAKAEVRANDLLKQLRAGGDFAKLATANSDDPGSAAKGGDLDWVVRGQTVKAFEAAAFSLKPQEISNVIKTEYGFHILQVLEKEQARVKPFEEVKDQIASDRRREAVFNKMQQSVEQARADLAKAPQNAQAIAAKYDLSFVQSNKWSKGESVPELGTNTELESALAGLKQGEVSPVVQLGPSKLGVVEVTELFPARPAELAEVEGQIRTQMTNLRTQQIADQKVREVTDKLKAVATAGGDLSATAKQLGVELKTTDLFGIEGAAEGIGSASYLSPGFAKPVGSLVGPFNIGADVFLAKVVEKQGADLTKLAEEREAIVVNLKRKRASERKELFEDGVITQLVKEGKVKKYNDTISRIAQGYRG